MSQPHVCSHCGRSYTTLTSSQLYKFNHFCPSDECPGHETYPILQLIKNRIFAEQGLRQAQGKLNQVNKDLETRIEYTDDMDDIAIPDGEGHFYLLSAMHCTGKLAIRHTASMTYKPEPPDVPSYTDLEEIKHA